MRAPPADSSLWAGYLLGFALGGFFDGILLHQILQWHHLLSAVQSAPFAQLRTQLLADGLFHPAMYAIALAALFSLWRCRATLERHGRTLLSDAAIGFGAWHVLDAVLSHWLLEIHRIRMDASNPLLWDLAWLGAFGLVPLALGALYRRRGLDPQRVHGIAAVLALATLAAGTWAAFPPRDSSRVAVLLARPSDAPRLLEVATDRLEGRILWSDARGAVWIFEFENARHAQRMLRAQGALWTTRSTAALGCLAWSSTRIAARS